MKSTLIAIAAAAALAGCSAGSHASPGTAQTTAAPATRSAAASPSPAASPSVPVRRLTIKQAARAYVRIVGPWNAITDAINRDYTDAAPFSQYRADALALVRALRTAGRQFRAVRWPRRVQPYITSLLLTFMPADIRCTRAGAAAGSRAAAANVNDFNPDCQAAADSTIADTIRSMLNLPPRS